MFSTLSKNNIILFQRNFFLLFLLFSLTLQAQHPVTVESINKQFEDALHYVTSENPEKAIPILNEINKNCKTINYMSGITRVGHTLAIIYFNSSDYNKVINLDDEFVKVGNQIKDYEKLSHIYRLKACAYSELGLLDKGSQVYDEALQLASKIPPGNAKQHAIGVIYGNLSSHQIKSGAPQSAIFASINRSIAEAEKINEREDDSYISKKYSLIAYSYIIMANEYLKANNQQMAGKYYHKALDIHTEKPVPLVEKIVLLSELGYFYNEQREYDKAIKYAELGVSMEKKGNFPQVRKILFETLSKSYLEIQKTEESKKYLNLFTALNDSINNNDKKYLSHTISKQEQQFNSTFIKQTIGYLSLSIILIITGLLYFLFYKKKKQKQLQKVEKIVKQLKERQNLETASFSAKAKEDISSSKEDSVAIMPLEAEEKLLEKLYQFEQKKLFLERKVSLSYVATEIETNTKYLSYIIKKHKGKDFNKYINELRIDYIVQKISDDPAYRNYKINTLAEETGFSSHSKFATIFKAYVGSSPSEFIKYLEQKSQL